MTDRIKMTDQIRLLEAARTFTDTGVFPGLFTYPDAGYDLVRAGLVTEDRRITAAGRAALWFLGKGNDPFPDTASSYTVTPNLNARDNEPGGSHGDKPRDE